MADNDEDRLYTSAEIVLATGVSRQTLRNRAKILGFNTSSGSGYTAAQVLAVITMPIQLHRKNEENAMELREKLNRMFEENGLPMAIVQKKNGQADIEFRATAK